MYLDNKYSIDKDGQGFALVEKTIVNTMKDGKLTGTTREGQKKRFYGTVYQALQGFLTATVNDTEELKDVRETVFTTIEAIDKTMDLIKESFRTEVRVVK